MLDFILQNVLQNIPADAPEMLSNFISEKEQELQGKLYAQLSYKTHLHNGKPRKDVVLTIFLQQPDKTFPLPEFNNKPIKNIINDYKQNIPGIWKMFFTAVDVPNLLNGAFEKLEHTYKGSVKIFIYQDKTEFIDQDKTETIFELRCPEKKEIYTFQQFLTLLLNNPNLKQL